VFGQSRKKLPLAVVLALLAGCSSAPNSTVRATKVTERLNGTLYGDIQGNHAVLSQVPAGTTLVVDNRLIFPGSSTQLDVRGEQLLNRIIQALFVVRRTQVLVDDCPRSPAWAANCYIADARGRSVVRYLHQQGFDPALSFVTANSAPFSGTGEAVPAAWDGNVTVMTITDLGP
jgi:hypothetical protein